MAQLHKKGRASFHHLAISRIKEHGLDADSKYLPAAMRRVTKVLYKH
jgi:hypothetical protein